MHPILKSALALSAATLAIQASAEVTFYEHDNFQGRAFTTEEAVDNFRYFGFNDRASSVVVQGRPWEVCDDAGFRGRCLILRPGNYPSLRAMNMNDRLSSARAVEIERRYDEGRYAPQPMPGQITFFEHDGFQGRAMTAENDVPNFVPFGFNDRASSVVVLGERWEACEHVNYGGRCVILRPGRYPSLSAMGLNDTLSSVRMVHPAARFDDARYAPQPVPAYDWRRRHGERLYDVEVRAAHAVYATPQQHCWVEREQVVQDQRRDPNVGGAIVGGVLGGILGHQIGGGTGRDIATVGGAVAGAAIGANAGRDNPTVSTRNVQRCAETPARGQTVTVNESGEPRL